MCVPRRFGRVKRVKRERPQKADSIQSKLTGLARDRHHPGGTHMATARGLYFYTVHHVDHDGSKSLIHPPDRIFTKPPASHSHSSPHGSLNNRAAGPLAWPGGGRVWVAAARHPHCCSSQLSQPAAASL
jgi:hypothetical protein